MRQHPEYNAKPNNEPGAVVGAGSLCVCAAFMLRWLFSFHPGLRQNTCSKSLRKERLCAHMGMCMSVCTHSMHTLKLCVDVYAHATVCVSVLNHLHSRLQRVYAWECAPRLRRVGMCTCVNLLVSVCACLCA